MFDDAMQAWRKNLEQNKSKTKQRRRDDDENEF